MAYYSGSGATIRSGAAGLGEYFDAAQGAAPPAPVQAFQEGVFGGGSADIWMGDVGDDPGPLRSYHDGSLGACHGCGMGAYDQAAAGLGMPLWIDGKPVDRPVSIMHGPASDPTSAFRDGSLGESPVKYVPPPVKYVPPRGSGVPWSGAFRDGSLGAVAAGSKTVDLTDPQALKETKMAIAMIVADIAMGSGTAPNVGAKYYDEAFYADPIWSSKATELWDAAAKKLAGVTKSPVDELSQSSKGNSFPTASGLAAVLAYGVGAPVGDPKSFATNFPVLSAWYGQVAAAKGSLTGFKVSAPFFTVQEKVSGKSMFAGMSKTSLALGVGAVVAVGAFFAFRKKK